MGQVCGKIKADEPCYDSPYRHKQEHEQVADDVKVQVVVGLWPTRDEQAKLSTGWDDFTDVNGCTELSDSASSNICESQRTKVTRTRRRSSQENSGSFVPSTCGSIVETGQVDGRATSETSWEVHQQARRRLHALNGAPVPTAHAAAVEEVPSPIEGLTIGAMVGRGAWGRVYRGMYNGSRVAVKVVDDVDSMSCDENGIPVEASLSHSLSAQDLTAQQHSGLLLSRHCEFVAANAVPKPRRLSGHSCSRTGSECWMLFDYCDKGCLLDAVEKGWFGSTDPDTDEYTPRLETVAVTAHEIASAMAHLHGQGIVHGDLSSSNIMLHSSPLASHGFTARVGDFGMASKAHDAPNDPPKRSDTALSAAAPPAAAAATPGRPARTASQMVMSATARRHSCSSISQVPSSNRTQPRHGTATHMPPEALIEQVPTSKAGDVFAFGVLLWEMLTGQRAWGGLGHPQVVFQVAVLGRSLEIPEGLPPHLHTLLARCMAREPATRHTFNEAVQCLEQFLAMHRTVAVMR